MSSKIFRMFNPGAPKEDPVHKRRAQLRRAQRSYRDRKEIYTKSLEKEVAQTKAREVDLTRQCEQYRETIRALSRLLLQNGIETPPELKLDHSDARHHENKHSTNYFYQPWTPEDSISPEALSNGTEDLDVGLSFELGTTQSVNDVHETLSNAYSPARQANQSMAWEDSYYQVVKASAAPEATSSRLSDLDQVVVGMEFVLTIESPCLGHLHGDPDKPEKPTGHALTTSAQLISLSSSPAASRVTSCLPLCEKAPTNVLKRLLELSSNLCPEDEITPTQAWEYLRKQPQFGGLEMCNFKSLTSKLREAVKCHGFGAVMDRTSFENLVFHTLIVGRLF